MNESDEIFNQSSRLLTGVIYREVKKYPAFVHLKSFFNDGWYNFLVPTVWVKDFPWSQATGVVESEAKLGYDVSFYIHSSFLADYQPVLKERGHEKIGSEVYMVKTLDKPFQNIICEYENVTNTNIDLFVNLAKMCFPDWDNNEEYSRYFHKLSKTSVDPNVKNFISKSGTDTVGFGGVVISRKLRLAYLHNTGVLESFRRRGFYSDLVRYRCNKSLELGVSEVFALVEENSESYHGLEKLGFRPEETYYLFCNDLKHEP